MRHAVTEFFDHVFGLVDLRKDHSHGGIAVSDDMYPYIKKKFQGAKDDHLSIHVGNKDRSDDGPKNIDVIKITNEHVMKLFNKSTDLWLQDTFIDFYVDMLNLSIKDVPLDNTISDMLVLKMWDLNRVLESGNIPPKLKVTKGQIEP